MPFYQTSGYTWTDTRVCDKSRGGSSIAYYKNNTSAKRQVTSIWFGMASGSGTFYQGSYQNVYGNGSAIGIRMRVTYNGTAYYSSNTITVSNRSTPTGPWDGYSGITHNTRRATFNFEGLQVNAGGTVYFYPSPTDQSTASRVLCIEDGRDTFGGTDAAAITNVTVTFKGNGGATADGKTSVAFTITKGSSVPDTSVPTFLRTGYTQSGWSGSWKNVQSNVTINANWTINKYTVTFNLAGGTRTGGGALSQSVQHGGKAVAPSLTPPAGKSFVAWTPSNPATTVITSNGVVFTATYTAIVYTITFNFNGGHNSAGQSSETRSCTYGQSLTPPAPTRTGYTFAGWNSEAYKNVKGSATITALWTPILYNITYVLNEGNRHPLLNPRPATQTGIPYGAATTVSSNLPAVYRTLTYSFNGGPTFSPATIQVNCKFLRWNTQANGGGTNYNVGSSITLYSNVTLYAIWENTSLSSNGQHLTNPPRRNNYEFRGWTTTLNGNTFFDEKTVLSADTTIYAKWAYHIVYRNESIYPTSIIYNKNNLDSHGAPASYARGDSFYDVKDHGVNYTFPGNYGIIAPSGDPSTGDDPGQFDPGDESLITFAGWNTSPNQSTPNTAYNAGATYTGNTPLTLYPVYQVPTFKVRFTDGHTKSGNSTTVYKVISEVTVQAGGNATPPPNPKWSGHTFHGWLGRYTDVRSDQEVIATWDFTPIWIYKRYTDKISGRQMIGWIKYKPEEDK